MMLTRLRQYGISAAMLLSLLACGGGGSGGGGTTSTTSDPGGTQGTTTFNGGTLDALKALKPDLVFDNLVIAGPLTLPLPSSTTIRANKLTITPAGKVQYDYSTCQYTAAPNITFTVTNDVLIEGSIILTGRSGTTTTSGATCNSCNGQRGGNVEITGGTIKVPGDIRNDGGGGASVHFSFGGTSACSSGASGSLKLAAVTTMDLSGVNIDNTTGTNFEGTPGASGTANIGAGGVFTMVNGEILSTGAMTFSAASTNIFGSITYKTLTESIGGQTDVTAPVVTVQSPIANAVLPSNQAVEVKVQASDAGMGLKNVRIKGLGYDKTHPASDFVNGTLTVLANAPEPATLDVIGTDNKGVTKTITVAGFTIPLTLEAEPNDSLVQAQTLFPGGVISSFIQNGNAGFIFAPVPTGLSANISGQAKIEDFYKVVCCDEVKNPSGVVTDRKITVSVDFLGSAATTDIDVFLFNSTATVVIASSTKDNFDLNSYTEAISKSFVAADMGQTFYIGIQAWDVVNPTAYKIKRCAANQLTC